MALQRIVGGVTKEDQLDLGGSNSEDDDPEKAATVYAALEDRRPIRVHVIAFDIGRGTRRSFVIYDWGRIYSTSRTAVLWLECT